MTVIAYRAGILAADTNVWDTSGKFITGSAKKIARLPDGSLVTCYGISSALETFKQWILDGRPGEKPKFQEDCFGGLVIRSDGAVERYDSFLRLDECASEFYQLSCNPGFTLGCLYAGASAERAVRLTLGHTDAGGGPIQVERLGVDCLPADPGVYRVWNPLGEISCVEWDGESWIWCFERRPASVCRLVAATA